MRAMIFEQFGQTPHIANLPDPTPEPDGVVVNVRATGVCRERVIADRERDRRSGVIDIHCEQPLRRIDGARRLANL